MSTTARFPQSISNKAAGASPRGLFLVPRERDMDLSRGEASESSFALPLDTLEQARRIVAQVEREMDEKAARERTQRLQPAPATEARPGFWTRAARAIGI